MDRMTPLHQPRRCRGVPTQAGPLAAARRCGDARSGNGPGGARPLMPQGAAPWLALAGRAPPAARSRGTMPLLAAQGMAHAGVAPRSAETGRPDAEQTGVNRGRHRRGAGSRAPPLGAGA
jgi:hypothetical protein